MFEFPKFNPVNQTLENYLQLMKVVFIAADVYEEDRQVGIILTHIPKNYFDDLVSSSASISPSCLPLAEMVVRLKYSFKPKEPTIKCLIEFQD